MENENKISLLQYYNQHFASFCFQYGKPNLRLSKKLIHQLRVDIKNMRAIFDLLNLTDNEKGNLENNITVFDKLFKAAGNVREEQVNLSIVNRYFYPNSLAYFKKHLNKRKRSAFWVLHKTLKEFNLTFGEQRFKENKEITEDEKFRAKEDLQKIIDETNKRLEELFQKKEKEVLG